MNTKFEGKTVEEAIAAAARELNLTPDRFTYEITEMPTKGFLGIGAKNAVIEVTVNNDPKSYLSDYIRELFLYLGVSGYNESIEITEDKLINIQLDGDCLTEYTERNNDIVDSVQFLLAVTVNKKYDEHYKVTFNINDYKEKSAARIEALAVKNAKQVQKTRRKMILYPMSAYQRRIVHSKLQGFDNITTYSIGTEPDRKVVIAYQYPEGEKRPYTPKPGGQRPAGQGSGRNVPHVNFRPNTNKPFTKPEAAVSDSASAVSAAPAEGEAVSAAPTETSERRPYRRDNNRPYNNNRPSNGGRYNNNRNGQNRGGGRSYGNTQGTEDASAAPQKPKIKQLYPKPADDEGSEE